jgi:conjugal transfer pilus assembly protein TraB
MKLPHIIKEIITHVRGNSSPDFPLNSVRRNQLFLLGGIVAFSFLTGGAILFYQADNSQSPPQKDKKPIMIDIKKITTALDSIDERDIWVNRVEQQAKEVHVEAEKVRKENEVLEKRIDILEELFKEKGVDQKIADEEEFKRSQDILEQIEHSPPKNNSFPPIDSSLMNAHDTQTNSIPEVATPKLGHITRTHELGNSFKTIHNYLPATTTCKAVMTSGIVAPAGPESKNNPKPVTLRIVDDGNLPRGFISHVRNAEINAACHGDISTERVECRLVSMTWVEPNGTIIERDIEGWIYGEDGSEGLRGKVVDRSGDVAREAYLAGMLSGFAGSFKMESQSTLSPFLSSGISNPLNPSNVIQGAASSGISNAMEKLANRSIKRLDQMQPVIVIAGGRLVDIRFKTGVSLENDHSTDMKVATTNTEGDS